MAGAVFGASCEALELKCRDEDVQKNVFFRNLKNLGELSRLMAKQSHVSVSPAYKKMPPQRDGRADRKALEHGRNKVSVCSWNTNGIMVWAWMLWSSYALGTRTELWFGHGGSGHRMLLKNYGLGMDALVTVCSWNTNGIMVWAWMLCSSYVLGTRMELWFGHGCSGHCMLLERERNYGLGMDALVTVCFWNTNGIMVWAWMLWSPYALGTQTEPWFGHGGSGHRMLLDTNGIMVWA